MKERGQILVVALFFSIGLVLAVFTVANIGIMAAERVKLQNTVDAAAFSAATVQARYMNLSAYINRSMVANYDSIAFNMALYSTVDSFDHGGAMIAGMLFALAQIIPVIGLGVDEVGKGIDSGFHSPMHSFNRKLLSLFDPDKGKNLNQYLERYNTDILSMYQGILYVAAQGLRASVEDTVARRSDPDVNIKSNLQLAVESDNFRALKYSVDYAQGSSNRANSGLKRLSGMFDSMMGEGNTDAPLLLGAVTEASMDRFAAGRKRNGDEDSLRNFNTDNIIHGPGWVNTMIKAWLELMKGKCRIRSWAWALRHWRSPYSCPAHFDAYLGAKQRWGKEKKTSERHVPIISASGIREVTGFGGHMDLQVREDDDDWVDVSIPGMGGGGGDGDDGSNSGQFDFNYSSGTANTEIESMKNVLEGGDAGDQCGGNGFWGRFVRYYTVSCDTGASWGTCTQGKVNACLSFVGMQFAPQVQKSMDTHFDGTFSSTATAALNPEYDPGNFFRAQWSYRSDGGWPFGGNLFQGVPNYKFKNPLKQTGITEYILARTGAEKRAKNNTRSQNAFEGPSVVVAGNKPATRVAMLRIAGITNPYGLVALARGQVYYKNNPKRTSEIASSFNPHWGARLAPLESRNQSQFQNSLVPFVASQGIPISPNH